MLGVVGCVLVTSCGRAPDTPISRRQIRIATGLPGMTFKPLGEALRAAYARVMPDVDFDVVESEGSVRNLQHLQDGTAELGLALADVAYMGYNGHIAELSQATRGVRGVAVLHPSTVHLLVAADSHISSVTDLRGRRLGIGPSGSGTAVTSTILLSAFGVPLTAVQQRPLSFLEANDALLRGDLDAVFIAAADPVNAVTRATAAGAHLVDIDGPPVDRLRADYPFLRPASIPAATYPGQTLRIKSLRVDVLLLCSERLDDVIVYRLTKSLFDVLPELASGREFLTLIDVRRAPTTPVPLHPGAAWYYRERELSR
jgi:TRAP transporter TAXI family solute receptor